jgi:hypothetical protein
VSFCTENSLEPRRAFRFRLGSTNGLELSDTGRVPDWWNAKTVTKPSYSVSSNEYQIVNQKYKVPGVVTWEPITIALVDLGKTVEGLVKDLSTFGWNPDGGNAGLDKTKVQGRTKDEIGKIRIEQLNGQGKVLETWELEGAFISRVAFGNLDYGSDDLVEIQITVDYDYALLKQPEGG